MNSKYPHSKKMKSSKLMKMIFLLMTTNSMVRTETIRNKPKLEIKTTKRSKRGSKRVMEKTK